MKVAGHVPCHNVRTQWQFIILYNRHLTAKLVRLMGLLEAAGVQAVTFKGPVMAAILSLLKTWVAPLFCVSVRAD